MSGAPPFTALPNWLRGKATCYEIAILWVMQSHYGSIRPSIHTIAREACISRRIALLVIRDMTRKGWVSLDQIGSDEPWDARLQMGAGR